MALTFDEFGMWLHLGGSYWQRASFDAVVVVLSGLGLLALRRVGSAWLGRTSSFNLMDAVRVELEAIALSLQAALAECATIAADQKRYREDNSETELSLGDC